MFQGKNYMIIGMARSGIASAKALKAVGACVFAYDAKTEEQLSEIIAEAKPYIDVFQLGQSQPDFDGVDRVVVSPGVPLDLPFFSQIKALEIPMIGEIELAYELAKGDFIGITGTNGKTTTTSLLGEMYKAHAFDTRIVGNIGNPAVLEALTSTEETKFVTELSSFQLESIQTFRAKVAAILNITPDHLNRHKTLENYIEAKKRIFENQESCDFAVLNHNDAALVSMAPSLVSEVWWFSSAGPVVPGAYLEGDVLVLKTHTETISVCKTSDMLIFGEHNIENALAAIVIAHLGGVSLEAIRAALKSFKGVEHRIEYVSTILGRPFYNDSKATNPDAAIKAVKAMSQPTVLIAGGMDKGSTYETLFEAFTPFIKAVVVFGETKEAIKTCGGQMGYHEIFVVNTMDEAVEKAYALTEEGDAILLSPACASWDMYPNFEVRGEHFKRCVHQLMGK